MIWSQVWVGTINLFWLDYPDYRLVITGVGLMVGLALYVIRAEIWSCLGRLEATSVRSLLWLADRHFIIEKGRAVWSGVSAELREAPQVLHEYVGVWGRRCNMERVTQ